MHSAVKWPITEIPWKATPTFSHKHTSLTAALFVIDLVIFLQYLYISFSLVYFLLLGKDLLAVKLLVTNIFEKLNDYQCQRLGALLLILNGFAYGWK